MFSNLSINCNAQDVRLDIDPIIQETPGMVLVVVGEMIFRYYNMPNLNQFGDYQCGIVGALVGPNSICWNNCRFCSLPAYLTNTRINMIKIYPKIANFYLNNDFGNISATSINNYLSENRVRSELDNDRPIIVGIYPTGYTLEGISQHVALIIGYYENKNGETILIVNDPWPYDLIQNCNNPYEEADFKEIIMTEVLRLTMMILKFHSNGTQQFIE